MRKLCVGVKAGRRYGLLVAWLAVFVPGSLAWGHAGHGADADWCPPEATSGEGAPEPWVWQLPKGFPEPRVPPENPMSAAKVELGRHLFYDKRLSGNGQLACAGCHVQRLAFTDGRALSRGSTGDRTARSAQHLANSAWHGTYTWANPALVTLERQMLVPLFGDAPVEMGVNDGNKARVLARFQQDKAAVARFQAAFPGDAVPVTLAHVIDAIAAFERTLISGNSRFDQYQRGEVALGPAEMRGKDLFFGEKAECYHCHGSFNFDDQVVHTRTREAELPFHNTGLYNVDGKGAYPASSQGTIEVTGKPEDMGRYRAPSLRNVAMTAPYMHDGSITTLAQVIATYAAGGRHVQRGPHAGDGRRNPWKSELIGQIRLTPREQADLLAFLKTLTDPQFLTDPRFGPPPGASR